MYEEFYKRVWIATLKKAKKDLLSKNTEIRNDALAWFLNDEIEANTFYGICFYLDFNPDEFRKKIFSETRITKKTILEFLDKQKKQKIQAKRKFIQLKKNARNQISCVFF